MSVSRTSSARLAGRRILVVGAGSQAGRDEDAPESNGRAIALAAAAEGAAIVCGDLDEGSAAETATRIEEEGGRATVVVADIAEPAACDRLVSESVERLGSLDGVVLNAGIGAGLGLSGTSVDDWDQVLAVNLRGHFLVAKAALPAIDDGGSLVFIGSVAGLRPGSTFPAYDSSKAGLIGLCRHVALEGAGRGVRANVVAPGLIDTPLGRRASQLVEHRERVPVPMGRHGTAREVASAVVFLLSAEASYITAQVLAVDGGLMLL